jgi:hypothetical protein
MKKPASLLLMAAAFLALGAFSGCTGYADGPSVSFRKAEDLLIRKWVVTAASDANADISAEYANEFFDFQLEGIFRRAENAYPLSIPPFTQDGNIAVVGEGQWSFLEDERVIELIYTVEYTDPFNSSVKYRELFNEVWEITRLTETELRLRNGALRLRLEPM